MAVISSRVIALIAQAFLLFSLICCTYCAKLPAAEQQQQHQGLTGIKNEVLTDSSSVTNSAPALGLRNSLPIVASTDDLQIVAHTGSEGLGRQKRYIGWGRRPSLRYSKATSVFDHDSMFNRLHNNFEKRAGGPEAPISSFRELRMKQKIPNIQLLLPNLQMRNVRTPVGDGDEAAGLMMNEERNVGAKLTQEDLDALAYLLEGDMP
ncbi:unnamed protein product [Orchesella dallaii]|uniref:Uncharacterized protein n=1 Tax=Orchesella dallaii TaxID=48710 RepID=A0ABP1RVQ5_9HEXA